MSSPSLSPVSESQDVLESFRKLVSEDLRLLATLHDREPGAALIEELKSFAFPSELTLLPDTQAGMESIALMHRALSALPDDPGQGNLDELAADYASIYLNHNISASPEESVWVDEDGLKCQDSMFQVRDWYESHGLGVPDWRLRPDDHLVYQLQFIAWLLDQDKDTETLGKIATFMDEHLLRWLGNFAERVIARCDTPYFAGVAGLTAAYCETLREVLADLLQQPRPSVEEIEERMQPKQQTAPVPVAFVPGMNSIA